MGFLDRVQATAGGAIKAAWQTPAIAVDLGMSTFTDDDYDGVWGTISGVTADRFTQSLQHAWNAHGNSVGATYKLIPQGFRDATVNRAGRGLKTGATGALDGLMWANKELVQQPLATVMTVASMADAEGVNLHIGRDGIRLEGVSNLIDSLQKIADKDTWSQAYVIANTRSLGQSMALAFGTKDIMDEREVARYMDSDHYWWTTGTIDAISAVVLDPTAIVGKGILAARAGHGIGGRIIAQSLAVQRKGTTAVRNVARNKAGKELLDPVNANPFQSVAQLADEAGMKVARGGLRIDRVEEFHRSYGEAADLARRGGLPEGFPNLAGQTLKLDEGAGRFRSFMDVYAKSSNEMRQSLRSNMWNIHARRGISAGTPKHQIEMWIKSPRRTNFETAIGAYRLQILGVADNLDEGADVAKITDEVAAKLHDFSGSSMVDGHAVTGTTLRKAEQADIEEMTALIHGRLLNQDKNTANIARTSEVLARAFMDPAHIDDAVYHEKVWRGLMGDGRAIRDLHGELQKILTIEGHLDNQQEMVALVDMMHRMSNPGRGSQVMSDTGADEGVFRYILDNEDVFPSEVMADIVEDAMARGDDALAHFVVDLGEHVEDLNKIKGAHRPTVPNAAGTGTKLDRVASSKRFNDIRRQERRIESFMKAARANVDVDSLAPAPGLRRGMQGPVQREWNQARFQALIEHSGALKSYKAMFQPKARLFKAEEAIGNFPQLRYTPRVTLTEASRMGGLHQASRMTRPVRWFTNMKPKTRFSLMDDSSGEHIQRILVTNDVPIEEALRLRGAYDIADTVHARRQIFEEVHELSIRTLAAKHGMSEADVDGIIQGTHVSRNVAYRKMKRKNLRYNPDLNQHFLDVDAGDELISGPFLTTQTGDYVATPDWRDLDRLIRRRVRRYDRFLPGVDSPHLKSRLRSALDDTDFLGTMDEPQRIKHISGVVEEMEGRYASQALRLANDGMSGIMKLWMPAVLLRPAWAFKVVFIDENVRALAKFGGLVSALDQLTAKTDGFMNLYDDFANNGSRVGRALGVSSEQTALQSTIRTTGWGAAFGFLAGGQQGMLLGAGVGFGTGGGAKLLSQSRAARHVPGGDDLVPHGWARQDAIGSPTDGDDLWRANVSVSSSAHMTAIRGNLADANASLTRHGTGKFIVADVNRDVDQWSEVFTHTVNRQIGQDPVMARILNRMAEKLEAGEDIIPEDMYDEITDFLINTAEGRQIRRLIPQRNFDVEATENWSRGMNEMALKYFAVDGDIHNARPELLRKITASDGPGVSGEEWLTQFNNKNLAAPIHGEEITETLSGADSASHFISTSVERAFNVLGRAPSDNLSRIPMFNLQYKVEMRRLLAAHSDNRAAITAAEMRAFQNAAKETALKETRQVMYELGEVSEFGEMTRMIMPFFGAWQEALTRYTGLAYENPVTIARALSVWNGDFWDEDEETGDSYLTFQLPDMFRDMANSGALFRGAFDTTGEISLNKKSLNMLGTLPGIGPLVQFPLAQAIAERPELESTMEFLFPYGAPESVEAAFLPAWMRRAKSAKMDDEAFARMYISNLRTAHVQMELGDRDFVDMTDAAARQKFADEIRDQTKAQARIRTVASLLSPAAVTFRSPYDDFIQAYRTLQEEGDVNGMSADDRFLMMFGEDYFALTEATTRSMNGVPPTLAGVDAEEKYGDVLARNPELGGLIVGEEGGGEYNKFLRTKYNQQINSGTRELKSPDDILRGPSVKLGWIEYSRVMDHIEYQRVDQGLPNLRVKEAERLADEKRISIQALVQKNPEWAANFYSIDRGAWDRRIEGLREIANTAGLGAPDVAGLTRPDLAPLSSYLRMRDQVLVTLEQRKADGQPGTLAAAANQDLVLIWEKFTNDLVEQNLAFASLFYRYLDNDPLRAPLSGIAPTAVPLSNL